MSKLRDALYGLAAQWDGDEHARVDDPNPFTTMLDEVLFHADLRYRDYKQFPEDGDFPARLSKWLENVSSRSEKKALFQLLQCLIFIDRAQIRSLYRDAYHSVISPWFAEASFTAEDFLAPDYGVRLRNLLKRVSIFSITQSFSFPDFLNTNSLTGIKKPTVLPEAVGAARALLAGISIEPSRIIVLEDFVGSGRQARRNLALIVNRFPRADILFVPLVSLQVGYDAVRADRRLIRVRVAPVFQISRQVCLEQKPIHGERQEFEAIRGLIKKLKSRVLKRFDESDDCPDNEFGNGNCGALFVSAHNTPNSTLPLIHHRAPKWSPLFRRMHHDY